MIGKSRIVDTPLLEEIRSISTSIKVLLVIVPFLAILVGLVIKHSSPCSASRSLNNLPLLVAFQPVKIKVNNNCNNTF